MEQLDSRQIHLWLAWLGEITDSRLLAEYRSLLSEAERQRQMRFHFERDRHRYLVTRAMVRTVLSKYADIAPHDWHFTVNEHGRPSIIAELTAARGINFNISHTDGLVVMGVTRERAIGVDVENVRAQQAALEIADRFFAPEEVAELRALPAAEQPLRFFEYWTLKEAYIKARGMGLSIPLNRFWFKLSGNGPARLMVDTAQEERDGRWRFWQLCPDPAYLAAVCAESGEQSLCMLTRRMAPTVPDERVHDAASAS